MHLGPGPHSPRQGAVLIWGHELNLPRAAQEGLLVPGCPAHPLERTRACFAVEKASNELLSAQWVPSHSKGCDHEKLL